MTANPLQRLHELGQSIWYDYIRRDLFSSGKLERLIREDALTGMTSNPTIFQKAIAEGELYDEDIRRLGGEGRDTQRVFEGLAVDELGDQIERVADRTRLVQRDDRGVGQPRAGERLAGRSAAVAVQAERDSLDGHLAVQQLVMSAPHHPKATGSETLEKLVATEHETVRQPGCIARDARPAG